MERVEFQQWFAAQVDAVVALWLRLNMVGCNMNRRSLEAVRDAGFRIVSVKTYKPFFPSAPTPFPSCLIRAEK